MLKQLAGGKLPFFLAITLLFMLACLTRQALEENSAKAGDLANTGSQAKTQKAGRIVSLAPNITESLYALGLGERIVGVTSYCNWPPEAASKARIGGFGQVDLESVLRLQPDLVILHHDQVENARVLKDLGLEILLFRFRKIDELLESIAKIGQATGHSVEATEINTSFATAIMAAKHRAEEKINAGRARPRVLFIAMRNGDADKIDEVTAIGNDGFYSQLIGLAGGENAWKGRLAFPRLSAEAIIRSDPDLIIEVLPSPVVLDKARQAWQSLDTLRAVKNGRIHLLADNAHTIPGPRAIQTLRLLSSLFYPEKTGAGLNDPGDEQ